MTDSNIGKMGWIDLTVDDADNVKNFYQQVVGWKSNPVEMGGYQDYSMQMPSSGVDVVGICHKRGVNDQIPSHWIPYFIVADINQSIRAVKAAKGELLSDIRHMGNSQFVIIKDPAGAVCALYQE